MSGGPSAVSSPLSIRAPAFEEVDPSPGSVLRYSMIPSWKARMSTMLACKLLSWRYSEMGSLREAGAARREVLMDL